MRTTFFLLFALYLTWGVGQETSIEIENPSFEDVPRQGGVFRDATITGWYDCGELKFRSETPPDLHPINAWKVTTPPSHGNTYLGMVVRDNDTWESVAQRLRTPLEAGQCYSFSIELARSKFYVSGSRKTNSMENYTEPAVLRIWGGTGICGKQELLGVSVTVSNSEWRTYEFKFEPQRTVTYFTLEAFYQTPTLVPYNGHLLLDNASEITLIPCDEEQFLATESSPEKSDEVIKKPNIPQQTAPVPVAEMLGDPQEAITYEEEPVSEPEVLKERIDGLYSGNYSKGDIIRINSIYFDEDADDVKSESTNAIKEIYDFMLRNKGIIIEVGGHTNTVPPTSYCDDLSSRRAKAVAKILAAKGIPTDRLYYKGYGKRKPIVTHEGNNFGARRKNQRVEIKILKTDYSG